jgi:hypothetical protein
MVLCGKCEFSRTLKERNHIPRLEYQCLVELSQYGTSTVMGVKGCSSYHSKVNDFTLSIEEFKDLSVINPTSLTICANLGTYLSDMDISDLLDSQNLKWIDMMCNQGKALKEYIDSQKQFQYVIGVEPHANRTTEFEYHRIYVGDPATIRVKPKPNLITSRYGFYYANLEAKMKYLKAWYDLLERNGVIVIYPYFVKTSHDTDILDEFIDKTFKNVERQIIKKDLVRLRITK